MKLTVVTICFNEEKNISKTIESVLKQSFNDFEYIICDAQSTDATVQIAQSYKSLFLDKGVSYIINSEKDKGIYDGMNKGIEKSSGEYIYFLNAGDMFFSETIIENVIETARENDWPDILYGNVATIERNVTTVLYADHTRLEERMSIFHPGFFCKSKIMKETGFNSNYKIGADYHFVLGQFLKKRKFIKLDNVVAYFASDGVSNSNVLKSIEEQERIKTEYGVCSSKVKWKIFAYKTQLKFELKKLIPQKIWEKWSLLVKGKKVLENLNSIEERINLKVFKGCEGLLIGDVIHYNCAKKLGLKAGMSFLFSIIKRAIFTHYDITVKGVPKTICLMSGYCASRSDHRKAFLDVVSLIDNCVIFQAKKPTLNLSFFFEIFKIRDWNKQLKCEIKDIGSRFLCLRIIFDAYLDYIYFEKMQKENSWEIDKIVTFCDVHPVECFFTQKFNEQNKITVTLQHGIFSLAIDPWAYIKSKSKYMLTDSQHSVDSAKSVGYKNIAIPVGSMHCINNKIVARPTQFKNDVIGIIMNSNMTPKEDNIRMVNIVQEFCKKYKKRALIKYHPNNNIEDYKSIIDTDVTEECEKTMNVVDFLNEIDVAVVCDSTVFTTALYNWIPVVLFYREGFDVKKYLNSEEVKFSSLTQFERLITMITDNQPFFDIMERYREYYLSKGDIKENYRNAFKEIGINDD